LTKVVQDLILIAIGPFNKITLLDITNTYMLVE